MSDEPVLSREEVLDIMGALADLRVAVTYVQGFFEEAHDEHQMGKERRERARRKAENDPSARRLRELVERGRAELEARRRATGEGR